MATTDFDFQSSRDKIIQRAFRICGDLALGEPLTAEKIDQGNQILNDMVKSWQADHVFLWSEYTTTLTLVAGTETYSLPTDPLIFSIDKAFFRLSGVDFPLEVTSYRKFQDISNKSQSGSQPVTLATFYDRASGLNKVTFWPVPDSSAASGSVLYTGICRLKDFDSATSTGDFSPAWTNALVYGVADDLADEKGLKPSERQIISQKAAKYLALAKKGDKTIDDSDFVSGTYSYRD